MKANKIIKAASVVLTASIAFAATGCTIEVKDQGNTVDRIIAAAEKSNLSANGVTIQTQAASADDTAATADTATVPTEGMVAEEKSVQIEETSKGVVEIDNKDKTYFTVEPTTTENLFGNKTKPTEPAVAETTAVETTVADTQATTPSAVVTTAPTAEVTAAPTQTPVDAFAALKADTKKNYVKPFDFFKDDRDGWYLDCELGYFELTPGDKIVQISYNGIIFDLPITYCDELGVVLANSYLVDRNGTKYIWICDTVGCDMHDTNVYKIGENEITLVGVAKSVSFPKIMTTEVMDGFECGGMGIMRASREYKVGDDGMPVALNDIRTFDRTITYKLSFWKELEGNIIVNGKVTDETAVVPYNTFVSPIETDGNTYLDVEDADGNLIRLDISETYEYHYKYFVEDIFYEGIMELVLDWKEPWL